jgi:S-ribosylhomocysteine lyase LuxS involved in autoinducer biosynthesis
MAESGIPSYPIKFFSIQFCKVNRVNISDFTLHTIHHMVMRLPQEQFGSHMIFIFLLPLLLFSIYQHE